MSLHDALVAPVWMAVSVLLVAAAWRAARRALPADSVAESVLHATVLCYACVVGVGIVLGAAGALSAPALLAGVAIVAVATLVLSRYTKRVGVVRSADVQEQDDVLAPASSSSGRYERPKGSAEGDSAEPAHSDGGRAAGSGYSTLELCCWAAWGVWAALLAGRLVVAGLLEYPTNWDTLTYHLPFVDQWLITGSLYVPGASKWFFPGNNELVALWMVAPFSGNFFAPLNNFPAILLLVLAAVELARMLGVAPLVRHLGALALVSNYIVWHQVMDNKNDVTTAALFLCCLLYAFRYAERFRRADLLLAAACLGLLAGMKYYAVAFAGIAMIALVGLTWSQRGKRAALAATVVCLAGLTVWAGYWYGRNLYVTGTPVFPTGAFLVGNVDTGSHPDFWSTTLLGNDSSEKWWLWLQALWRMTGPFHVGALLLLPGAMLWLYLSGLGLRRREQSRTQGSLRWALLAVTAASALLYAVTPFTVEVHAGTLNMVDPGYVTIRLGLCFLALVILCSVVFVNETVPLHVEAKTKLGRGDLRSAYVARSETGHIGSERGQAGSMSYGVKGQAGSMSYACWVVMIGALAYQFSVEARLEGLSFVIDRKLPEMRLPSLLVAGNLVALGACIVLHPPQLARRPRLTWTLAGMVMLAAASLAAGLLGQRWHTYFAGNYNELFRTQVFTFLQQHGSEGERICVLTQRSYPFAGSGREHLVLQAHNTAARPEAFSSREALLEFIHHHGATMVAVRRGSTLWYDLQVDQWSERHPGVFTTKWNSGPFVLKRVDSELLAAALEGRREEFG